MVATWAEKEMRNLSRMHQANLPVPKPVLLKGHVLVMEFLGDDGWPAPLLKVFNTDFVPFCAGFFSIGLPLSLEEVLERFATAGAYIGRTPSKAKGPLRGGNFDQHFIAFLINKYAQLSAILRVGIFCYTSVNELSLALLSPLIFGRDSVMVCRFIYVFCPTLRKTLFANFHSILYFFCF